MCLILFLDFNGTLFDIFVQADAGRDARVGADDIRGRYCGAAQQIGRDARLQRRVGSYLNWNGQSEYYFSIYYIELSRHLRLPALGLLLVALGVLLLCPRELDVESGISSEGSSQPWHDFFELESAFFTGTKVNQSMRVRKLMICFYKETTKRRTKAEDSITKGVSPCLPWVFGHALVRSEMQKSNHPSDNDW